MKNPFTPTFGKIPPHLAGREYLVQELLDALENGPGDPNQTSILVGARGTGKTATLAYICSQADSMGWISVSVTCVDGMMQDILEQIARKAGHVLSPDGERKLSGIDVSTPVGGFALNWENGKPTEGNWRTRLTDALERLNEQDIGLLITVDEVDPRSEEMVSLVAIFQHFVTEERKVALFMAGLPHRVSQLLNGESVSFLRRAGRKELSAIPDIEVGYAFEQTAADGGKRFEPAALEVAVRHTFGFPYMMQLIGFRSWASSGDSDTIALSDVERGIKLAEGDLNTRVLKQTLDELSDNDLLFLQAMLEDGADSEAKALAERLGKSSSHVSAYKRRLLDAGVIEPSVRARVRFSLPGLREYLAAYLDECGF